jgi:hypothetical protein
LLSVLVLYKIFGQSIRDAYLPEAFAVYIVGVKLE